MVFKKKTMFFDFDCELIFIILICKNFRNFNMT